MNDPTQPFPVLMSDDPVEPMAIHMLSSDGAMIHLDPTYAMNLGSPHISDEGVLKPPVIGLYDGGDADTKEIGVYFSLNSVDHIRAFAQALLDAADVYEALLAGPRKH